MDNRPIGVFDSGLGGLSALRVLSKLLPNENLIYFGDTARVPYGNRSKEILKRYAMSDIAVLRGYDIKYVLIACGTVSSVVDIDELNLDIPIAGVIQPTVKAAAKTSQNGRVGVIATAATINSDAYKKALTGYSVETFQTACPLFVPLVEAGFVQPDNEVTRLVARQYLEPLLQQGIDTLILGCTHYPLLAPIISRVAEGITLIDSGAEAAAHTRDYIIQNNLSTHSNKTGEISYLVSDLPQQFAELARLFVGHDITPITVNPDDTD